MPRWKAACFDVTYVCVVGSRPHVESTKTLVSQFSKLGCGGGVVAKPCCCSRFIQLRFTGYDHQEKQENTPDGEHETLDGATEESGIADDGRGDSDQEGSQGGRYVVASRY